MSLAAGVLLCCAAATPRDGYGTSEIDQQRPRPGVWAVPELVPNGAGPTDPSTVSTDALAAAAAEAAAAAAAGAVEPGAESGVRRSGATGAGRSSGGSGAVPITLSTTAKGIPARVLTAYKEAADQLAADQPGCHLPWELLAAIGKVESGHAAGRPLAVDGTVTRPILGPALNGLGDVALIRDTDDGALDGDTRYDRAVGPMQFIPTTWAVSGRDGNGDGRRDPHNIHDATLAAGHYLCAHGRDLADPDQLRAAIHSYNPSDAYVRTVLTWMAGYRQGGATAQPGDTSTPDALPITRLTPNAVPPATAPNADTPIPTAPASTTAPVPTAVPTPNPSPEIPSSSPEIPSSSPGGPSSSPGSPSPSPGSPDTPVPPPSGPPSETPTPGATPVQPASPTEQPPAAPAPAPTRTPSSPTVPTVPAEPSSPVPPSPVPPSPPASPSSPPPAAPATTAVATPSPPPNPASTPSSADTAPEPTVSEPRG
ncbi:hypothetical protein CC117_29210 [Parafrankia colletiae]|uniref:Transglycosylase SLT domain-containing protein n=1 Tax=Parafrankia colletiae TaxID=573497 RepID=A0A1S1Q7J7_9ACTN|nr:lytic murein transglycosylase [Parafrankia colletiae]MCK9902986.1 lytic murein transglycosylase [Frankia sp. Cpl3]OHV29082.1 hypothetical protein CC117_29210 [Parafrankia colletiae]